MKRLAAFFLMLALQVQAATYVFTTNDGTATGFPKIAGVNSSFFGLDGSGNLVMVANATFATAVHGHVIGDVTNLETTLNGKQPLATVLTNTTAAFTTAQETKLAGIASGATANSADATLLARANHTGTQVQSTVTNLVSDLAAKASATALTTHTSDTGNPHAVTKAQVGLGSVENTALSTWTGANTITTLGTIGTGTWQGTPLADSYIASATTWNAKQDAAIYGQLVADYTLTSTTASQRLFDFSATGAVALPTGRHRFSMMLFVTDMSTTSSNARISLLGSGSATLSNVLVQSVGLDSNSALGSSGRTGAASDVETFANNVLTSAVGTQMIVEISGIFNVTVAGTIIPSISLSNSAAAIVKTGSFIELRKIGPTGSNVQGPWQ